MLNIYIVKCEIVVCYNKNVYICIVFFMVLDY